ncbi:hypothetical protein ACG94V_20480 [Acinetobacter sp. ULE_I001]|uniref:hypothetical protein n=1 Tax=unclassified Acinetobacter TaxID=196816 RepID=UPI00301760A7
MRSWYVFVASAIASLAAVLSLVVPFCFFLYFYQGDLFISASERSPTQGIQVVFYLTPFFLLVGCFSYTVIFKVFKAPQKIIETTQIIKSITLIFIMMLSFLFLVLCLDGALYSFIEVLSYLILVYLLLLLPFCIGLSFGNAVYLILNKKFNTQKIFRKQVHHWV